MEGVVSDVQEIETNPTTNGNSLPSVAPLVVETLDINSNMRITSRNMSSVVGKDVHLKPTSRLFRTIRITNTSRKMWPNKS
jgi:hypothetical protein